MSSVQPYPQNGYLTSKVPPYPFASTRKKSELNLRENMKILLEGNEYEPRRGHWVLLRRMDLRQKCTCWNQKGIGSQGNLIDNGKYNEPKLRCPVCHGEGWVYQDELHLMRRVLVAPAIGLAAEKTITEIGFMAVNYIVFYMMHYVNPKKEDKIIEVALDDNGVPTSPVTQQEIYSVAVAEPYRDLNGRIEYWRAACKLELV